MIARLTFRYLLVFAVVLALLSAGAYMFLGSEYQSMLQPALGTPEGAHAYRTAMTRVTLTILAFDIPLLALVGAASWLLARASLAPLLAARVREREFAADAAHRLRSPLATIAAVAQAARPEAPDRLGQDFDTITQAAMDASQTVGELLTLSRPATSQLLQREPVDVAVLSRVVLKEFTARAAQRGLLITNRAQSAIVNGDERRLRELLRTLQNMGKTIIISSHILLELAEMCSDIAILQGGRLIVAGDVEQVTQVNGFVLSTDDFGDQPKVINAASDLLVEVLGDAGRHTRAALGTNALPFSVTVEITAVVVVRLR